MSLFKLYLLLNVIPNLGGVLEIAVFVLVFYAIYAAIVTLSHKDCNHNDKHDIEACTKEMSKYFNKLKISSVLIVITLFAYNFLPTKSDIMQIYGIHYLTSNEQLQQLPNNALMYLNQELQQQIKEGK